MASTTSSRLLVAGLLLDAGCVTARTDEPFRLPSGWASPVYMDCRRLISFPAIRRQLTVHALAALYEHRVADALQAVAGGESSGIAVAGWLADALSLPMQYVRKKAIGRMHIEGVVAPGSRVLMVDDMMAAGQSKLSFIRALRDAEALVEHALVLFDYATFDAAASLERHGVATIALSSWTDVLAVARERQALEPGALGELQAFLDDPGRWSQLHGGIAQSPPFP